MSLYVIMLYRTSSAHASYNAHACATDKHQAGFLHVQRSLVLTDQYTSRWLVLQHQFFKRSLVISPPAILCVSLYILDSSGDVLTHFPFSLHMFFAPVGSLPLTHNAALLSILLKVSIIAVEIIRPAARTREGGRRCSIMSLAQRRIIG